MSRWHRLVGDDTWFLTGTDEHGLKIQRAAEANGLTPVEQADRTSVRYRQAWAQLDIANDDFIRTTEPRHHHAVQALMQRAYDNGYITKGVYEGLYCVACEAYYTPDDLDGENCRIHGRPVEQMREENYFFQLSAFADQLLEYYTANPGAIRPDGYRNEVLGLLRQGLEDVSVSRTSITWGVPVPWDTDHVFYVWYDALINYATAVGYGSDPERFATWWPAAHHVIGKDIIRFHCVYWPAMLLAAGVTDLPSFFVHGWLLIGGEKMSKSKLNNIAPADLVDGVADTGWSGFGVDGYRYHFLRDNSFGPDGDFSYEGMVARYNADLANQFGNLVQRIGTVVSKSCGGIGPAPTPGSPLAALSEACVAEAGAAWAGPAVAGPGGHVAPDPGDQRPPAAARALEDGAGRRARCGDGRCHRGAPHRHRVGEPGPGPGQRGGLATPGPARARRRCPPAGVGALGWVPRRAAGDGRGASLPSTEGLIVDHPAAPDLVWFDNHCHLPEGEPGDDLVTEALAHGVIGMVVVGTDRDTSLQAIARASAHPAIYATVGLHPHDASSGFGTVADLFTESGVVAVGEAGFDFHYDHSPRTQQRDVFAQHIEAAHEHDLPLVVHTREAWAETFDLLDHLGWPRRTVLHCFTGGLAEAARCVEAGAYISFSGIVTFPSAAEVRAAAAWCPVDRLLVETDSPYLAPVPNRGRKNRPAWVGLVGAEVARLKATDPGAIASATVANTRTAFGLDP